MTNAEFEEWWSKLTRHSSLPPHDNIGFWKEACRGAYADGKLKGKAGEAKQTPKAESHGLATSPAPKLYTMENVREFCADAVYTDRQRIKDILIEHFEIDEGGSEIFDALMEEVMQTKGVHYVRH
jgi:hypothetical protein